MKNPYLRSLLWHSLCFLLSEVFLFILMEWNSPVASRTSAEASVMYLVIVMPVLYGLYVALHMLFLLFTHFKKRYKFPFNPVSAAFLFDLVLLSFIGTALDQDRALTNPLLAIAAGTFIFLLIEICHSFYAPDKALG
ncbi:hypothetical protein [Pontibacter ramchanderi]|uniref:Uncharacterized protein n=1 Tax=Pontibacter ramchanderi TaxID=1179743 RepID=A0A2N3U6Q0_9BACT|nr:hypothetical protein [Pontibacter ramchanderi]PKV62426.1 hypothetical protein BD749_3838 [Pontibacter ramchanderi]